MKTINQTLRPEDMTLGHWAMWTNEVMFKLEALRITPKKLIDVSFEPVEYHSDNGKVWECDHAHSHLEAVLVLPDDSDIVRVCDACDAQLINGEWVNG